MRILAIGDVVGLLGCKIIKEKLKQIKEENQVDFVIANGENSAVGNGITKKSADYLFSAGVNVLTGGNHSFRKYDYIDYIDKSPRILRPANYPNGTPGKGFSIYNCKGYKICIMNILGIVFLEPLNCPFECLDQIIEENKDCKIKILDFHAEATAEKRALGFYADGRISAMFGTHTHVQTSDEEIFPNGMSYISDIGMTGAIHSVLGVKPECSIKRMKNKIPLKFEHNNLGPCKIEGVCIDIDENTGKSTSIKRIRYIFN